MHEGMPLSLSLRGTPVATGRARRREVLVLGWGLAGLLLALVPATAQAEGCDESAVPTRLVQGVFAEIDGVVYANPRIRLAPADAEGRELSDWTVLANGTPAPAEPPPMGWAPGAYDLVARGPAGCGDRSPVRLVVDSDPPVITPLVARAEDLRDQVPDMGREKRFLWWWIQPEKQRLVWTDGATYWDSIRQRTGVVVSATSGKARIFVWAPDESPFEAVAKDVDLTKDRILILEAKDATSGIGALRLRLVEGKDANGRPSPGTFRLVVEAADRVGNSATLELPYQAKESAGPRRGPF